MIKKTKKKILTKINKLLSSFEAGIKDSSEGFKLLWKRYAGITSIITIAFVILSILFDRGAENIIAIILGINFVLYIGAILFYKNEVYKVIFDDKNNLVIIFYFSFLNKNGMHKINYKELNFEFKRKDIGKTGPHEVLRIYNDKKFQIDEVYNLAGWSLDTIYKIHTKLNDITSYYS